MIDSPTTTPGTPDAVRVLEQTAMRLYRDAHPNGPLWQELSDQTRIMWVARAEKGAKFSVFRRCEFCGCSTNAKQRACCQKGRDADRAAARGGAA